jgi:DNA-binding NtrC family response regulator
VHATIERQSGPLPIFTITDHGSKNGTHVYGRRVTTHYLEDGAIVRTGGTLLQFGRTSEPTPLVDGGFVGSSAALRAALDHIDRVADKHVNVLVIGESGTGKELAAARLHEHSGRTGRFVPVNCGAIPAGLVESYLFGHKKGSFTGATHDSIGYFMSARDGTLFLDEIGELPLELQPKLLRVLESRELSPVGSTTVLRTTARIVAATNVDLHARADQGLFRLDLLARLQEVVVTLPPLRTRRPDILSIAKHFFELLAPDRTFEWTPDFAEALLLHDWQMNVRELRAVVQRVVLLDADAGPLRLSLLPDAIQTPVRDRTSGAPPKPDGRPSAGTEEARATPDAALMEQLLRRHGGNVAAVAKQLGKDRKQIYRWIRKHGLDPEAFRDPETT